MSCPCGKGPELDTCCGPIIHGDAAAPTAEALMRSRYAAYVMGAIDHLSRSRDPRAKQSFDRAGAESWSRDVEWQGLDILDTEAGGENDDVGVVEFVARYIAKGQRYAHHERSCFARIDGTWFYSKGKILTPEPAGRAPPKIGRNEPCPCGSGKKYKRCHGG